jgi:hypothetical protein
MSRKAHSPRSKATTAHKTKRLSLGKAFHKLLIPKRKIVGYGLPSTTSLLSGAPSEPALKSSKHTAVIVPLGWKRGKKHGS